MSLYECKGSCTKEEIFNCNYYLGIADAYVEYGEIGNTNCMDQTLERLKLYGIAFWLMHTQEELGFMSNLVESFPETCCICDECCLIHGILRRLGENCQPISTLSVNTNNYIVGW